MNTKFFLLSTLMLGLLATSLQGAALFPSIVDPGPYDAVADSLSAGTGTSVQGLFFDNAGSGTVDAGDEVFAIYGLTAVDGGPLAGPYMAIAMSGEVQAGTIAGGDRIVVGNGSAANSLGTIVGNSSADIAILTSDTLDFSALSSFTQLSDISDLFSNTAVNVEALFSLAFGNIGTNLGNFSLVFGGEKISTTFEPVDFLPVSINRSAAVFGVVGTADIVMGSGSFIGAGGTTLGINVATATGFNFDGNGIGSVNPIPEPASLLTLLGCVAGVGAMGRRRRKAAAAA